jgi:beta-N-acetylhexosaminidase
VPVSGADPVVGDRAYGTEPGKVAAIAGAIAEGLAEGGVLPVLKHIPGHGRATADSHHKLPVVSTGRETLDRTDFAAFRLLKALPMAMTAHVVFSALDPLAPATVSPRIVRDVIRDSIGFMGLLMSDDISMQALSGSVGERSKAAIAAGCDVILHCNGQMPEMREVAAAVPVLTGESAGRAATALATKRPEKPIDIAASRAEFARLMSGIWQAAEGTA